MTRLPRTARACVATLLITCVTVAAAQVPTELDWDTNAWPGGSLSETFTVGSGDVQISWSGDTGALIQGRPVTAQVETGGLIPAEDSLSIRVNYSDTSTQEIGATIDFTHPGGVTDASFTIFDIDAGANPWIDQIQVTATDGVSTFNPSSVTVVDPAYVNFDGTNTVTGLQSADSTSPLGNASFTFNQPGITQINLVYRDPPGALPNPGNQFVAIHDINFTYEASGPNLALTKTDSADPVSVGGAFTYNLTVTNNGPGDATNVTLIDTLPAGVDWQSATPSQGLCVHSGEPLGGTVTCTLGTIANGANATVDIEVVAPGTTGVISNSATVSADEPDPDASDNTATEETTIVNPPGSPVCQVDPSGTYIEAENFTGTIVQGATFAVESTTPGFNGSGYLRSTGGSTSSPPVHEGKIYNIEFTTSGTYNVWMRGYALDGGSDSAFIGLNGTAAGALNEGGTYNTWVWSNGIQTGSNQITVPAAGFQNFNTWVREANHRIDGFYLTQGAETPTGGIPPGTPTLDPTQCTGANLALTKTDSPDPVSVGTAFTYSLTATNNGPVDATNVTLVDTLPADVDWQLATPSQGLCVHSGEPLGGTVTCTLGTIANGANATVDIEVVAPGTTGVISNSATVSADEPDPDTSDNTATEETTIIDPVANLNVTQTEDFDPAGVNLPFVYTVTVTNPGPADATLVTLVDTLDAAVTFQTAVPSQGSCVHSGEPLGGTVTCDLGDLNNGSIATIDITVIAPATPQTVISTAVVSAAEPDSDLSDNTWAEDTDVIDPPPADLELTMTDAPDPVVGGTLLTYTLTINNLGPGPATLVQLTDTLPASVIFVSATSSQGSCGESFGVVDCSISGAISAGASATVTIVVTAPATAGTITNSASVSTSRVDPIAGNDSASVNTAVTIIGDADLALSKSDSPDPVNVNQALSYSLIIDNLGPDDATDVVLVDTLPAAVTFQSAISSQGSCSESGGTVTCNLGMINNAANATVDIIVTAPASAGSITNNAVVSTSASDSDTANDSASETTTVQNLNVNQLCYLVADAGGGGGGNDLLTRIDTADFDPLTNETNIGIGTGTNTIEAIAWNSATGVLYAANAGRLGTLNTTTGVFTALPSSFGTGSGALGNITFNDVDGLTYDATTSTLYGSERQSGTDVLIQINMATGAHVPNAFGADIDYVPMPPILGNSLTDDIAVDPTTGIMYAAVNSGGSTDRLIRINKATGATTDVALITVPDIEGLGTDPTGQLWGTSGTQRILYELNKATGVGSNGRTIDNGSDYEAVDCYAFSPSVIADLAVTKIVDDAAPAEGANATYTVTATNTGPGIATVVQLSDVLPSGVTFASAIVSQGTYNSTTGAWFVGTLGAGSNATLNLEASVDIGSSGSTITNTASVTFLSQNDPNAGNDVASADIIPIALPANLLVLKSVSTVRDPLGSTAPAALAIPGAVVQYEVSVTNSGGGAATETIITDTLSSNLTFLAGEFDGGAADIEIIIGAAAPAYCIAEIGGDTNTDGCFLSAAGDDLTVTIPVSASYPTGLTVGATAPDNVVVVHFRATVN